MGTPRDLAEYVPGRTCVRGGCPAPRGNRPSSFRERKGARAARARQERGTRRGGQPRAQTGLRAPVKRAEKARPRF